MKKTNNKTNAKKASNPQNSQNKNCGKQSPENCD